MGNVRRVFFALLLVLLAGCASTTVTRVVADDPIQYPHGKVHVGWSEYRLLFPLMIHADASLPAIGKSIPAQKAFRDISIWNCRSDDKEYPKGGRDSWIQKMEGSLHLLSEDQIMIDAYFLDSAGGRHPYPFSGKHRIVGNDSKLEKLEIIKTKGPRAPGGHANFDLSGPIVGDLMAEIRPKHVNTRRWGEISRSYAESKTGMPQDGGER